MIAALATTLFFAITPVFANRSAGLLGSTRANFWRLVVATGVLGAWAHLLGAGVSGGAFGWFVFGGVVGFGVGGLAMFQCLPRLGSNLANLIVQCGSAVAAATVEWVWLGTRLTAAQLGFAALTLAGIAIGLMATGTTGAALRCDGIPPAPDRGIKPLLPLSQREAANPKDRLDGPAAAADRSVWLTGLGWALLSAAGQGVGAVISRKAFGVAAQLHQFIDPATAAYQRVLGGLAIAALAFVATRRAEPMRDSRAAVSWVVGNALTGPILGVTCFQWALRTTPAGIVQPIVAAAPLLTIPFAAWLEGSRPRPAYYAGAALAVLGVTGLMLVR